jgi:hypothetical protein
VPSTSSSPADGRAAALQDEARRLLAAAGAAGLALGLLGGMGIRLLLGERIDPRFVRTIGDLDFVTTRRAGPAVEALLSAHDWEPQRRFNAVNGARRLLFEEPGGQRHIDVFVGGFQMCHRLPLLESLDGRAAILPAADLALTKLQIVALNAKDRADLYALLLACPVTGDAGDGDRAGGDADHLGGAGGASARSGEHVSPPDGTPDPDEQWTGEPPAIDAQRIATLAGADWGLQHTLELNLARLRDGLAETGLETAQQELVRERIGTLAGALERAPKSRAWRLRARVGERRSWFEEPEEVAR